MCKRDFSKPGPNRLAQSKRMLMVAAIIASGRCRQLQIHTIAEMLNERTGETWHERTIRRDVSGLVEMGILKVVGRKHKSGRPLQYEWVGNADLSRVMIDGHRQTQTEQPPPPETLQAILTTIPEPWELDDAQRAIATSVARLAAVMQTGDRRYLKANLAFRMVDGWTLRIESNLNAFDRSYRVEEIAAQCVRDAEKLVSA